MCRQVRNWLHDDAVIIDACQKKALETFSTAFFCKLLTFIVQWDKKNYIFSLEI